MRIAFALFLLPLMMAATCQEQGPRQGPMVLTTSELRAVLGPGDVIEVRVFNEKELSGMHQVSAEGTIRLPLVGNLMVSGLSPEEVTERIESAYNARFLKDAQINVYVKEFNSRKVYVLGQVKKPGPFRYEERMTVIAAIAQAGGTTRLADANRTIITREKEGKQLRISAEVGDIGKGQAADVELLPGDIVFVPETLF